MIWFLIYVDWTSGGGFIVIPILIVSYNFSISSGERYSTLEVFNIVKDVIGEEIKYEVIDSDGFEIKKQFMNLRNNLFYQIILKKS